MESEEKQLLLQEHKRHSKRGCNPDVCLQCRNELFRVGAEDELLSRGTVPLLGKEELTPQQTHSLHTVWCFPSIAAPLLSASQSEESFSGFSRVFYTVLGVCLAAGNLVSTRIHSLAD